jgi:hypothetical protein
LIDMHLAGCGRFWLWSFAGALVAFSLLAAASIGLFVLPFSVLAVIFVARRTRTRTEILGGLVGAASICFVIAWIQRAPDGFDSLSWLIAGLVLAVAGIAGYAVFGRRFARRA